MDVSDAETDGELAVRIAATGAERLRVLVPVDDVLRAACHEAGIAIDTTPVTHHGRVELPCWLREQAISWTRHRHGRVASQHEHGGDDLHEQEGGDDAARHPVPQVR
jgi:RHH-type proline utilization regulon transcriptional repressor/proline dehydrogenase/delta 1-pyrroline-5-carboxylate dehydrogenase